MSPQATAFPLCWPPGWPTTPAASREPSRFKTTVPGALANAKRQIELLGGSQLLLSSNYTLGNENPKEPGVVAYFHWEKSLVAIPCDRWTRIEANVQAIALTVEAMRGMERWGAKHMIKAMFTGFKLLPPAATSPWYDVLGVPASAPPDTVKEAYRSLAKRYHPDMHGDPAMFRRIQAAYEDYTHARPA
jgi:hypothetical protein